MINTNLECPTIDTLSHAYFYAKNFVIDKGYDQELEFQEGISLQSLSESAFLRELAWVILSSGLKEQVVRRKFLQLSPIFYNWESAFLIQSNQDTIRKKALTVFNHPGKVSAILQSTQQITHSGFKQVLKSIKSTGIEYLASFPYVGPVTKFHLAKNIGFTTAKPDRHLVRIARAVGINDVNLLCHLISNRISENPAVVDLVIWRYANLNPNYLDYLRRFILRNSINPFQSSV